MANSVGRFYNATLGDSQFQSDGEHTLFTTDSSTTRIIKEVKFNPQDGVNFSGGYLEVNGHKVADLNKDGTSLSGEFIVPPSSTVKLKLPDTYPVAFYKEYEQHVANDSKAYVNVQVRDQDSGTLTHTITQNQTQTSLTGIAQVNNVIDIIDYREHGATTSTNTLYDPYYWMGLITHDSNSQQMAFGFKAHQWGTGNNSFPIISQGPNVSQNYKGFAFDRDINRGMHVETVGNYNERVPNMVDVESNRIKAYGSLRDAQITSKVDFTRWGGVANSTPVTAQGSFSPSMTSSWPRAHCIGDWYFWIPSSSYSQNCYGVSLKTGAYFSFNFNSGWASSGSNDFTVSIDSENDRFVFWRPTGSSNIRRNICDTTITELEAVTTSGANGIQTTYADISFPNGNYNSNSFGACQLSDRMDGGFGYQNNSRQLVMCNIDGQVLYTRSQFQGLANNSPTNDRLWKVTMGKMSASDISAAGLSQPTFNIQMFGYTAN
jgi:hypothetical protein